MHGHALSQDPAPDTLMGDLTCADENAGSILVTHRVDQVTSKKSDHTSPAVEVMVVTDASAGI